MDAAASAIIASRAALDAGLTLRQHTEFHWSLRGPGERGWILNLYPTKGRVYWDAKRGGQKFPIPHGWTIESVVQLAVGQNQPQGNDRLTLLLATVREVIAELEKDAHCDDDDIVFAFLAQKLQRAVEAAKRGR